MKPAESAGGDSGWGKGKQGQQKDRERMVILLTFPPILPILTDASGSPCEIWPELRYAS
jgi:hypothetical protein